MGRRALASSRVGLVLALGVPLVLVGAPRLVEPPTLALLQATRALGPISGWRCAQSTSYVYDPRRDAADATLLSDAPEQFLQAHVPDAEIERVEANLHDGDTVLWTQVETQRRVYVLSPGRLQSIGLALDTGWTTVCNSHLGDWHIVAEHALE